MITVYHNPRCTKSRQAVQYLEEKNEQFEVVKYLDEQLDEKQLAKLVDQLGIAPIELVRTNEADWKDNFKGKELSDKEIISAMVKYPKLIQRPILVKGGKAVVARPTEKIEELL